MKVWVTTAAKYVSGLLVSLAAIFGLGWTTALGIHTLFQTNQVDAEARIRLMVNDSEAKIMSIHRADMDSLHGKIDFLGKSQETIIKQNYEMIKFVRSHQ